SDQPPDLSLHNCGRIEVEQSEITRIHFLKHEHQRGKKSDVTEQAGNSKKADASFQFIQPGHISGRVKGALCVFKVAAVCGGRRTRLFWGAHAPSRARFGASPKRFCSKKIVGEAPTTTREGACAPRKRNTDF